MLLTEKYKEQIVGSICCYDRVLIQGNLLDWGYAHGMTCYLRAQRIKIFDFPKFAQELREQIKDNVEKIAQQNNIKIEYIIRPNQFSKEDRIKKIIEGKNIKSGIVHIFSVNEPCVHFKPYYNNENKECNLRTKDGICLHYYIYFIDKDLGLCFLRIATYAPYKIQFYFNGHNLLAIKLDKSNIKYSLVDNAFVNIGDFKKAQNLSDNIRVENIHKILDTLAEKYLPFLRTHNQYYRWTIMQCEYSTDIIFKDRSTFQLLYKDIIYNSTIAVKPENIATFLGSKIHPRYEGEMGNNFTNFRILGTRIKHRMGANYIKIYDKFGIVLRIETTVNNVTQFKLFREIDHRDGSKSQRFANAKKNIYTLYPLTKLLFNANNRYLEFISNFDDYSQGNKSLLKISKPVDYNERSLRGFNPFDSNDLEIFLSLARGEFNINGFRNKDIKNFITRKLSASSISRILLRLRLHGIIKKAKNTYKYYLTKIGKSLISAALMLREFLFIPNLNAA